MVLHFYDSSAPESERRKPFFLHALTLPVEVRPRFLENEECPHFAKDFDSGGPSLMVS
jgi:hypothetical protein